MFKFFSGTIDELLAQTEVNAKNTKQIFDENYRLNYEEAVDYLMDTCKVEKQKAEEIANEAMMEDLEQTFQSLEKKGLVQVKTYNQDGTKDYELTELGKKYFDGVLQIKAK